MNVKRVPGRASQRPTFQVSTQVEDGPAGQGPIPAVVRFRPARDGSLVYLGAWAWNQPVLDEDSAMFRSWLEAHEEDLLVLLPVGQAG